MEQRSPLQSLVSWPLSRPPQPLPSSSSTQTQSSNSRINRPQQQLYVCSTSRVSLPFFLSLGIRRFTHTERSFVAGRLVLESAHGWGRVGVSFPKAIYHGHGVTARGGLLGGAEEDGRMEVAHREEEEEDTKDWPLDGKKIRQHQTSFSLENVAI